VRSAVPGLARFLVLPGRAWRVDASQRSLDETDFAHRAVFQNVHRDPPHAILDVLKIPIRVFVDRRRAAFALAFRPGVVSSHGPGAQHLNDVALGITIAKTLSSSAIRF